MHPGDRLDSQGTKAGEGADSAEGALPRSEPAGIGRELGGDLPCVVCGYNLRGLSIRGVCPECGAGVRATILAVVDPQANVLQPIRYPRVVAAGLLLWTSSLLCADVLCWAPVTARWLDRVSPSMAGHDVSALLVAVIAAAGVGAATLVRPHAGISLLSSAAVFAAVVLHIPLGWSLAELARLEWPTTRSGSRLVLIAMGSLGAIFLLMRPIARLLVARSLLLRSGRVDRQTLYGMAAAAAILACGHLLGYASRVGWVGGHVVLSVLGMVLMLVGAALLTLGLLGSVVDSVRIAQAIVRPRMTIRDVVRRGVGRSSPP